MAATVAEGDRVMPATLLGLLATPWVASLTPGSLAQPPHVGYVYNLSGSDADVLWDNVEAETGLPCDDAGITSLLLLGESAVAGDWIGQTVQLAGGSCEFTGVVLQVATVITDPVTPSAPVDFVVVKSTGTSQMYWAALVADIELAPGR